MAGLNLDKMDVEALIALRNEIEAALAERVRDLEKQLAQLGGGRGRGRAGAVLGRASVLKGVKVAPKFRGPNGETWAGRGARPKWLASLVESGHDIEEFAVEGRRAEVEAAEEPVAKKRGRKVRGAKGKR